MSTKTINKTSFGMYAPLDYETYRKLRKIKAVANLSWMAAKRCEKWGRKKDVNRKGNPMKPCSLFFSMKEEKGYWDPHPVSKIEDTGLCRKVMDAYGNAQPVKTVEELQEVDLNFYDMEFNEVYHKCLKWYNDNFK